MCNIKWAKDGEEIQDTDEKYNISQTTEPEDVELNKFPSVISELSWNLHNWPENRLSHEELNFLISCFVDDSEVGDSISTSAMINIECMTKTINAHIKIFVLFRCSRKCRGLCRININRRTQFV